MCGRRQRNQFVQMRNQHVHRAREAAKAAEREEEREEEKALAEREIAIAND